VRQPETKAQIAALKAKMEQQQTDSDCSGQLADIERYIAEMAMTQSSTTLCAPLCVGLSRGSCAINSYLQPSSNIPSYSSARRILSSFCKPD